MSKFSAFCGGIVIISTLTAETSVAAGTNAPPKEAAVCPKVVAGVSSEDFLDLLTSKESQAISPLAKSFNSRLESTSAGGAFCFSFCAGLANAPSGRAVSSRTGGKIAFDSIASNLVASEINALSDVFVRTRATGVVTQVSDQVRQFSEGVQVAYTAPTMSADGLVVGFQGSNGQIFALDKSTGRLLSKGMEGTRGNAQSSIPTVSANGLRMVYESLATNLTPIDANGNISDIFSTHVQTGVSELLSLSLTGEAANGPSFTPSLNEDGSVVAFVSLATNLTGTVAQKAGTVRQVLITSNNELGKSNFYVSRNLLTNQLGNADSNRVRLTPDDRFGVFESLASNLIADDNNESSDIFRFQLENNRVVKLERVSISSFGVQANGASRNASISDDGQIVVFETDATNLVTLDSNGRTDVLVRLMEFKETLRATNALDGGQANGASIRPNISGDGATILYDSSANNLTLRDGNNVTDVFSVPKPEPKVNLTGYWVKPSEPGWGLTIAHQGDVLFPNWFTYGLDGKTLWLSMAAGARIQSDGAFHGAIYDYSGTPFSQINGGQAFTSFNIVGEGKITVLSPGKIKFDYSAYGISQSKEIEMLVFAEENFCTSDADISSADNNNYTDVWTNPSESGWGVHFTHQKDILFGLWYTFNAQGRNQWIAAVTRPDATGKVFTGPLVQAMSGIPFNLINDQEVTMTPVPEAGTVRFAFANGANMQMTYTLDGITQTKSLSRFQFGTTATRCKGREL